MAMAGLWWVWIVAGFVFGVLELMVPAFVFLGFAGGAVLTGVLLGLGLVGGDSVSLLLMIFAIASAAIWAALRRAYGKHPGQVKVWTKDINDN